MITVFSPEQIAYVNSLGFHPDFSNLSDDDYCKIEEDVGTAYSFETMRHPGEVTPTILMCESILDHLDEL